MNSLARRYAQAALDQNAGKSIQQLSDFAGSVVDNPDVQRLVQHPTFTGEREAVLRDLCQQAGLDSAATNLVLVLVENGRFTLLPEVVVALQALVDQKRGAVRARVVSAIPLSDTHLQRVRAAVARRLGTAVEVEPEIDATVLGGVLVQVGDLTLDDTLRHQLDNLGAELYAGAHL
jgi:F-type H+-transporting ATPase subunit delta